MTLKQVTKPLRWSNMATMPALPETQESIKEEIRRQVGDYFSVLVSTECGKSRTKINSYKHIIMRFVVISQLSCAGYHM